MSVSESEGPAPKPRVEREDASDRVQNALGAIEGAGALDHAMGRLRDIFGVKHISYVAARYGKEPHRDPYVLSTYPPMWLARYLFKRYWQIDPVGRAGFRRNRPFDWREIERDDKRVAEFFADAARYGVGNQGYLVPLQSKSGQRGILSVSGDGEDDVWDAVTADLRDDLVEVGGVLHRLGLRELFGDSPPPPSLSPREKESLRWVAEGKEVPDIAIITGLSEHTVRTYLKSARMKLDCGTKTQAAVKAERLALLSSDEP